MFDRLHGVIRLRFQGERVVGGRWGSAYGHEVGLQGDRQRTRMGVQTGKGAGRAQQPACEDTKTGQEKTVGLRVSYIPGGSH